MYTAEPPFRIIAISRAPIYHPGWYEGPWVGKIFPRKKYIFFPTNYVLVNRSSGEIVEGIEEDCAHSCLDLFNIILSFGYQDNRGYVTTIRLRRLINTMRRVL
jgi:hypothetical protein